ncbi:MAG TPA: SAM-dependent chlorinase/fluorinase [Anaerolineales bacterium]|nr:SAM-dependent chlorinase/fluorinase [Anaerolineales bacterium]
MHPNAPIVLLTDYGTSDPYVGILKGVISGIAPDIPVIDLTHEIQPGDLLQGAVTLWMARPYFPAGTVFCCVVDPGVGTARRAILVEAGDFRYIGPDNGLFTFVSDQDCLAWMIEEPDLMFTNLSVTFHGRDIFAPAAAHAARGVSGSSFGRRVEGLIRLAQPILKAVDDREVKGEILYVDRFGNLLTSLGAFREVERDSYQLDPWLEDTLPENQVRYVSKLKSRLILPGGRSLDWIRTFADKPVGECAVLVGSSGLLEVVANQGSAAQNLGLARGDQVTLIQSGD